MIEGQHVNWRNREKLSSSARLAAGGVFFVVAVGFGLLWASSNGYINLSNWFGVCGFKQRFGLPCPGCGWTHAAEMFVTGHPLKALIIQPAAGVFCLVFLLAAIFALHCAVFGIDFGFLQRFFCSKNVCFLLVVACFVIIAGWMVNLIRTVLEDSGV
ncbi:MAG: DUF2752 domain-containing protein [Planctomycetota bacterium]|jgi:hypothetical protein